MNRYLVFMVCACVLNFTGWAPAERKPYKVLDELRFSPKADQAVWKIVTGGQGKVGFQEQKLVIEDMGTQGQPSKYNNGIEYRGEFSLSSGTEYAQSIDIQVLRQNPGSVFYLVLYPRGKSLAEEPAVHVFITNGSEGKKSSLFIGRYGVGGIGTALPVGAIPFGLDSGYSLTLTLRGGDGKIEVSNGKAKTTFLAKKLFSEKDLIKPMTLFVGSPVYGNVTGPVRVELSGLRILTTRADELSSVERLGNGPGRDDKVQYVYLGEAANRKFEDDTPGDGSDGWTDQGNNDLRYIPKGYQYFRNVPFYVSDKVEIVGNKPARGCVILKGKFNDGNFPLESKPIEVNAAPAYLYFLQCSTWSGNAAGKHCADYVLMYEDGTTATIPLRVGWEIAEWWDPKDITNALVAWDGRNDVQTHVGFYLYEWKNPTPEKIIKTLRFRSTHSEVTPVLIAVTASPRKIQIGTAPRKMQVAVYSLCEYRQRHKTSLHWQAGEKSVSVLRRLPIDPSSEVKQARIDVIRTRAERSAVVKCRVGPVEKKMTLKAGQLKAQFYFNEPAVVKFVTDHKDRFAIGAETDDPRGLGRYTYESNPNHEWIPAGEDDAHGTYAISGVFQVTGWKPIHKVSGYIEFRPKLMAEPPKAVRETVSVTPGTPPTDWLGTELCLNGPWQWQPGGTVDALPAKGWQDIVIPAGIGQKIFELDPTCTKCLSAWFKREFSCPAEWKGKRIVLRFTSVCDFATVYVNGKKCGYHEGIQPFEVDITGEVKLGTLNTLHVFNENTYRGVYSYRTPILLFKYTPLISQYKGFAYRVGINPGPWYDRDKPDAGEITCKGKKLGPRVSNADEVVRLGDGRYYYEPTVPGQPSVLYFSTPGNVPFDKVSKDMMVWTYLPGITRQFYHWEFWETWDFPRARPMGILQDVFLAVTEPTHISDVFVKPSVRKGRLEIEVSLANLPPEGTVVQALVRDGDKVVLDLGTKRVEPGTTTTTLSKDWANPQLWGPSNPYLYYAEVELKTPQGNMTLDRRFVRFGFREFWIDGCDFRFNGKPIVIQGVNSMPFYTQLELNQHRADIRWWYLDSNQQVNANLVRWHMGGMQFPEVADIADEMGMLLEQESTYRIRPYTLIDLPPASPDDGKKFARQWRGWVVEQVRHMRNNPSVVMWSADNECTPMYPEDIKYSSQINHRYDECLEEILELNEAIRKTDPTRVIDNHGDEGFVNMNKWNDPRLQIVNHHYADENYFKNWRAKYKKPCILGEESLGSPFAWSYRGWYDERVKRGEDPIEPFYRELNTATLFITSKIKYWQYLGLSGIYPLSAWAWRHPMLPMWENVGLQDHEPDVTWPALSGPHPKRKRFGHSGYHFNFWDPKGLRDVHIRTNDALKDTFPEVPKLEPRFSPEVIVQVMDRTGKPLRQMPVWLFPTVQPGTPIGVITDNDGKAWFWCKSGPGEYVLQLSDGGKWYRGKVTPAPLGEWLQVKIVEMRVP
jgi:hypothetical protein